MKSHERGAEIVLDKVGFSYGTDPMLFELRAEPSAIVAVMGPSGSGKSTMLHLVAGFEKPSSGRILIAGKDISSRVPARRPVSMVFQENNLFAHLSVEDNVGLGRSPSLDLDGRDRTDVHRAIARTGLEGKEKRLPLELSGGERQRVALSRVLVRDHPVLLLDEPFASLGPALRREMLDLVRDLHAERGMTILMVTHHPDDAEAIADSIAFIDEGRVAATASTAHMLSEQGPSAFRAYIGT